MQKTAGKNTKYSRNETILKIGHLAKAIAHAKAIALAKCSVLGQKLKMPKTCEKRFFTKRYRCSLQETAQKIPNTREIRQF